MSSQYTLKELFAHIIDAPKEEAKKPKEEVRKPKKIEANLDTKVKAETHITAWCFGCVKREDLVVPRDASPMAILQATGWSRRKFGPHANPWFCSLSCEEKIFGKDDF